MIQRFLLPAVILGGCLFCHAAEEKLIIVDEGMWQADNGRLSYFEDGRMVSNEWFREINGFKLGDTPNDIIQISEDLIAISVNWSNIIQFINPDGKALGATEGIPNVRCLATDGKYLYASSYAHECETLSGPVSFEKGFVAKIDPADYQVVKVCEVGYEPEGIAYYDGMLFVANSGGYAFQEDHDYEHTVSILDADTMSIAGEVDTGHINLYGKMSQTGKYLCINSAGDYYEHPACGIILDCEKALMSPETSFASIPYAVTYNCAFQNDTFLAIGAAYSYISGEYEFNYMILDPQKIIETSGSEGISFSLPGSMKRDIENMSSPYGIYMNPYTGMIYATDAGNYGSGGTLYQWTPEGIFTGTYPTYINPGAFLALRPDSFLSSITNITSEPDFKNSELIFDIFGRRIINPVKGQIYIQDGNKIIY
ncbi:MAG: hypothetical protein K2M31_09940 [Muribaculaceae bacterium]|nr:hypothetical protein [Muribaculaceae bacterium]